MQHEKFMHQAIEQAWKMPDFPSGAILVHRKTGATVAQGHNQCDLSPTFHGEIVVINQCAKNHPDINWQELALYTTAEPCPMCQSAIEWGGIPYIYYGTSISYLRQAGWPQIDIRADEISSRTGFRNSHITGGILETECNALFDKLIQT